MERGRDKFRKYKKIINIIVYYYSIFSKKKLEKKLIKYRKTTGYKGLVLRYAIIKNLAQDVGDNVSIQPDVYLSNVDNLKIGNNVSIHSMCYIDANGGISIGDDVSIAHGTSLIAFEHNFNDMSVPIKDQGLRECPIIIKDNVWIGSKVTVLGNNTIESGAIIAAGAVVTKSVEKNCIVAGVPAKLVKVRS